MNQQTNAKNMVFASCEVRWFWPDTITDELQHWFDRQGDGIQESPPRTDIYLNHKDPELGIKWREGNLEIKRLDAMEVIESGHLPSHVGCWEKWSLPLSQAQPVFEQMENRADIWLKVHKQRVQRLYSINAEKVQPTKANAQIKEGCNVELAQVRFAGTTWNTLGFEAFSQLNRELVNLRQTLTHLRWHNVPAIGKARMMSYPQWLVEQVTQGVAV